MQTCENKCTTQPSHTLLRQALLELTEISWIVVSGAVKAQGLQIGDEVRDRALINALTLAEDVQLGEETHRCTE